MARAQAILRSLARIRLVRGAAAAARRADLLRDLARARIPVAARARATDLLLFAAAHPDDAAVARRARAALDRLAHEKTPPLVYPFDLPMVRALLATGGAVRFDRDAMEEDRLASLLPHLAGPAEDPALDDDETGSWEWLDRARGGATDAAWLVARLDALPVPPRLRDHLYDGLGAQISWKTPPDATRAGARARIRHPFPHDAPFLGRPRDVAAALRAGIRGRRLGPAAAGRTIALARAALAVRTREMFPIAHPNPRDVVVFSPGRGLEIVLLGTDPSRRLLLEGLWGFLLLKNGLPYGYGCVSVLWETAEIAWNVFPEYRGGESAWAYVQFLRILRHHLGARCVYVEGTQFGRDNPEAIRSGAFWFYRKLGFGPLAEAAERRIRAEEKRLRRAGRGGGRTPPARLIKFAADDLFRIDGPRPRPLLGLNRLARWGLGVTRLHAHGAARPSNLAGPREIGRAFELLAESLPPRARRRVRALARAKAAPSERGFVLAMNRASRYFL